MYYGHVGCRGLTFRGYFGLDTKVRMCYYFVAVCAIGFALQWTWEMAQMFAYREMAGQRWQDTVLTCTLATAGDILATLSVYGFIAILKWNSRWVLQARTGDYVLAGLTGALIAIVTEKLATAYGLWSYTHAMPVLPVIEVGVLPLLQLIALIPITLWVARRFAARGAAEN